MQLLRKAAVATLFSTVAWAIPAQAVEIEVAYPYSHLFDVTFERTMEEFKKAHQKDGNTDRPPRSQQLGLVSPTQPC